MNLDLNGEVFHGHRQLCEFLIDQGADVNHALSDTGETPLHSGLCKTSPAYNAVLKVLLTNGADPNRKTNAGVETDSFMRDIRTRGETPLHGAAAFANDEAIQMLLDAGEALDAKDANGDTPLTWASLAPAATSNPADALLRPAYRKVSSRHHPPACRGLAIPSNDRHGCLGKQTPGKPGAIPWIAPYIADCYNAILTKKGHADVDVLSPGFAQAPAAMLSAAPLLPAFQPPAETKKKRPRKAPPKEPYADGKLVDGPPDKAKPVRSRSPCCPTRSITARSSRTPSRANPVDRGEQQARNIAAVLQLGDITNRNTPAEWQNAARR